MAGTHLYIIQMNITGDIKIGRSKHPEKRLKQLQTGCPHKLKLILVVEDMGWYETVLHRRMAFAAIRKNGEWFHESALTELPTNLYEKLNLEDQNWWINERTNLHN